MIPVYGNSRNQIMVYDQRPAHVRPHLHESIEMVYVGTGTLELGMETELYHMDQGDFGIIFPSVIHHYQLFDQNPCRSLYIITPTENAGPYATRLQKEIPSNPVIKKKELHPDVVYAMQRLAQEGPDGDPVLCQAFLQIILTQVLPKLSLHERIDSGQGDLVLQVVSYISSHFQDNITLGSMAHDLGVSPYSLSRLFSGTFHMNFNQYLNEARLDHACTMLKYTDKSVTEISMEAGFPSLRTFNRVFKDGTQLTPREYRKQAALSQAEKKREKIEK